MFRISQSLKIYNASDKSGVLVFVSELNKVVSLAPQIGVFLNGLTSGQSIDKNVFLTQFCNIEPQEVDQVWDMLIYEQILLEGH
jgi:hypothetical protein